MLYKHYTGHISMQCMTKSTHPFHTQHWISNTPAHARAQWTSSVDDAGSPMTDLG